MLWCRSLLHEARSSWKRMASEFWKSHAADDAEEKGKKTKPTFYRTKAYEWLCATTHQLQIATGRSWEAFKVKRNEDGSSALPASSWPCCTVSVDQGGDGWSALHYLLGNDYNVQVVFDWSHRSWNDVQLAIGDVSWTYYVLVTIVLCNLDHGPWNGARWFQELKAGAEEYGVASEPHDPLLSHFFPHIAEEQDLDALDMEAEEEIRLKIGLCTQKKNQKVGLTRWFHYITAVHHFTRIWSQRLVVCMYVALSLGLFLDGQAALQLKLPVRSADEDVEKSTTAEDKEAVRKARASAKNTFEFVCVMLHDRALWRKNIIMCDVAMVVQAQDCNECLLAVLGKVRCVISPCVIIFTGSAPAALCFDS